jgi:lysophospholipase L1-like esterase
MNIFFFGDSICFGQFVSPHRVWVSKVAARLADLYPSVLVQNSSTNGRTTRQALEDMPFQVQANHPDVIYIQFGMNDCNYWTTDGGVSRVSLLAFEANLTEIIVRAKLAGAKLIILATNHLTPRVIPFNNIPGVVISYQDSNSIFNSSIRSVANQQNVALIDNESHWIESGYENSEALEKLILPDGVHLSEAGHGVYAEFITAKLQALLGNWIQR